MHDEQMVNLLLSIADWYFAPGDVEKDQVYFEQAARFNSQQLASIADFPHMA